MAASSPWKILLSPPEVGPDERALLLDAFDSNWIAPAGPDLDAFERELAELTGAPYVVALSSGTAGLSLALESVGVQPGDDVLVNTLTFAASAFAVSHLGARPCFVDCDPVGWHLDLELLAEELEQRAAAGRLPAAVVSVDLYGSVADGERIAQLCRVHDVPVVADAAEAVGAYRDGVHAGRHAELGVLSFNGNKMLTTGGGGAVFADRAEPIDRIRHMATQARVPVPWYEHEEVGYNHRLSNLSAAVGRGQLRTLATRIEGRHRVRLHYERRLSRHDGISFQAIPDGCSPNYWLTTIVVDGDRFGAGRDEVLGALRDAGIEARHGFKPMHLQPVYAGHPVVGGDVAAGLFDRCMSLPSGSRLSGSELELICDVVEGARR